MEGPMGPQLICRACLRIVENKTQSFGFIEDATGNLKDMIMCCVPEMDIYVSSNPIICFPCIQLLITVYSFKTRCLNTETIIRSFIQRNNLMEYNHVNLTCVVQELIRLNNYFREVHHRKIEGEKQNVENYPQNLNGAPGVAYGIPQGYPEGHFKLSERHAMPMHHENSPGNPVKAPPIQRVQGDMADISPSMTRSDFVKENQFFQRYPSMEEHNGMLHSLPINPIAMDNQNALSGSQNLTKDGVIPNRDIEESQNTVKEGILDNPNMQNNPNGTENSTDHPHCNAVQNHSSKPENEGRIASRNAEERIEGRQSLESLTAQSEKKTEDTDTSQDNANFEVISKVGENKDSVESRPRLIIKICKNKITIPSIIRNEDSNEKENEKMDVDMNRTEVPPPEVNPLEVYQRFDNGQELYQCKNCTFVTTHFSYYDTHQRICNPELTEKKCPHCPHVTNRQYALNKHINTMHTRLVWYTCEFCPYRSTDPSCLRRHKRNVHPERLDSEFMCQMCAYRCSTEYHLKKHMLRHDSNSILQCEFCSYSTRDRSNFRKHVFIHNPKPQNCEFCDYKCVSPYQMKLHLKKLHHGVGMEDVDCRSEVSLSEVVQDISAAIKEAKHYIGHQVE